MVDFLFSAMRRGLTICRCCCIHYRHFSSDQLLFSHTPVRKLKTVTSKKSSLKSNHYKAQENDTRANVNFLQSVSDRRHPVQFYCSKIKGLSKEKKVVEALELFYETMIKRDGVMPDMWSYRLLIGTCANNGYLTMAFRLFKEMRERGISNFDKPAMHKILTSLFKACAVSNDRDLAVANIDYLRKFIKHKGLILHYYTLNSMLTAYAYQGCLLKAFNVADEMVQNGLRLKIDTFRSLLIACHKNEESGLLFALKVLKEMRNRCIYPDLSCFNLLLKIIRDCEFGPTELLHRYITSSDNQKNAKIDHVSNMRLLTDEYALTRDSKEIYVVIKKHVDWWENASLDTVDKTAIGATDDFFNLNELPNKNEVVMALTKLTVPHEKLSILGGVSGFLDKLKCCKNVLPDAKTFHLLFQIIEDNCESENRLLESMNNAKILPDIEIFNILLYRQIKRGDLVAVNKTLEKLQHSDLSPNEITFAALAVGCTEMNKAEELLSDMKKFHIRIGPVMLKNLLKCAIAQNDLTYIDYVVDLYHKSNVIPNFEQRNLVEEYIKKQTLSIIQSERSKLQTIEERNFADCFHKFKKKTLKWFRICQEQTHATRSSYVYKPNIESTEFSDEEECSVL